VQYIVENSDARVLLDSQTEGAVMLYSSGTTGHPKGVRPPLLDSRQARDDRVVGAEARRVLRG